MHQVILNKLKNISSNNTETSKKLLYQIKSFFLCPLLREVTSHNIIRPRISRTETIRRKKYVYIYYVESSPLPSLTCLHRRTIHRSNPKSLNHHYEEKKIITSRKTAQKTLPIDFVEECAHQSVLIYILSPPSPIHS